MTGEVGVMRRILLRKAKSRFIVVKCKSCGNTQVTFSHAASEVKCNVCGNLLLVPTGGKAKIVGGEIIKTLE